MTEYKYVTIFDAAHNQLLRSHPEYLVNVVQVIMVHDGSLILYHLTRPGERNHIERVAKFDDQFRPRWDNLV